jgi:hypothetical protein
MLDIGKQELLVLFLVLQPQFDQLKGGMRAVIAYPFQELPHLFVDVGAVLEYLGNGGARGESARGAAVSLPAPGGIRSEEVPVLRIGRRVRRSEA